MTRRVISDADWQRTACAWPCRGKQLTYIPHARSHRRRAIAPLRIVLQEVSVLLHDRATPCCIHRDELRTGSFERGDVPASELSRVIEIAGVCVQRSAALLSGRLYDPVAVHRQNSA